jgi:hypothetical protein
MTAIEAQWEALCEDPRFQDLPYKVETNRFQQIIMSPASNWHSSYEGRMTFYADTSDTPLQASRLCPDFPLTLPLD